MSKFHKKIYQKLESSHFSELLTLLKPPKNKPKKIIPTTATKGLREDFKKIFLPLLIDVFELRQMIDNYKTQIQSNGKVNIEMISKSPEEILERLEQLQKDIEESQRWCDGVVLQIAKGISEAKNALFIVNKSKSNSILKRLIRKFTK